MRAFTGVPEIPTENWRAIIMAQKSENSSYKYGPRNASSVFWQKYDQKCD
jgi:hypothetical protein